MSREEIEKRIDKLKNPFLKQKLVTCIEQIVKEERESNVRCVIHDVRKALTFEGVLSLSVEKALIEVKDKLNNKK